ncbi:MAG: allantoinase PuuE [Rhizobiaceae bacterium]|jgi:urate oxidase|nr:allantoinase PuuE [Rhizobiaceae bacterium]
MTDYPRDMTGYGATPPDADWPDIDGSGPARIAVQFVLNYEEGGENNILHGDAASEAFLSEIVGAQAWPGQRHWNMESIYEYGARAGFWRLHRLFTGLGIPLTVYGVTTALERAPEQTRAMIDAGWEIASHGLKWIEHKDMGEEEERAQICASIARHEALTGERPRGWYTGRCSMNTMRLVAGEGGFAWLSDSYADDLPYWVTLSGAPQLVIPYTLDCNDMRFATPQGFNCGDQFFSYLKDTFDVLYAEGEAGAAKMMSVGLHCRLVGRPGRAAALQRFIDYAQSHPGVWFARRIDIAEHWRKRHPFMDVSLTGETDFGGEVGILPTDGLAGAFANDNPADGPEADPEIDPEIDPESETAALPYAEFMMRYAGVFEHSPWVAERAFATGAAGAASADELHRLMVEAFRAGTDDERLDVLNAHPDLAGKLAAAKRLTADSTAEQASAGLDALTDDERAYFETLNDAYKASFGFPFIMAVKGRSKADILNAFEARLQNTMAAERATAEAQVERIALLRLQSLFGEK